MSQFEKFMLFIRAHLTTTRDAGERAIFLQSQIASLEKREAAYGLDLSAYRAFLECRLDEVRDEARARIAAAEAAPSFAHSGEVFA